MISAFIYCNLGMYCFVIQIHLTIRVALHFFIVAWEMLVRQTDQNLITASVGRSETILNLFPTFRYIRFHVSLMWNTTYTGLNPAASLS